MIDQGLDTLAEAWDGMMRKDLAKTSLVPYQPTKAYVKRTPPTKLNIACGPNVFPGDWVNVDHADLSGYFSFIQQVQHSTGMPEHQRELWQWCKDGGRIEYVRSDAMAFLPSLPAASLDFVYAGQFIEHLNFVTQAPVFLAECKRVLKPGGILRLTTPDLQRLVDMWCEGGLCGLAPDQPALYGDVDDDARLAMILFGASGEGCSQTNYEGHFFAYTQGSLTRLLERCGFTYETFKPPKRDGIRDEGLSHSLVCEATA